MEKTSDKIYDNAGNPALINLVPESSKLILDVGCGAGSNARILQALGKTIDGITLSEEEIRLASKYCRKVLKHNLETGLPDGLESDYDVILCSHVLEHIAYPEKLLFDIKEKLIKPDAILLIVLPNFMNYRNRIKMFLGNFNYEQSGTMDYTHLRWYTYKSASQMLEKNGFEIVKSIVEKSLPWKTVLGYLPVSLQNFISTVLIRISKGFFGSQLIFIVRPRK